MFMAKTAKKPNLDVTRITRTIYFLLAVFALSIVIFDSGNLITRESVNERWLLLTGLFLVNTLAWYLASQKPNFFHRKHLGVYMLSFATLTFAGFLTYWERGMASTSTILYVVPLLIIATLKNRHALLGMAALAVGTYAFAAVKYFNDYFNEGYRIQLWGNLVLISGIIFTCAWLIMILVGLRHDSR